ncbi:hypothetical protein RUND412_004517 [Rhizina undulata]
MSRLRFSPPPFASYAISFGLWLPAVIFFVDHVASLHVVRGRSMHPTLSPDSNKGLRDLILVNRWGATEDLRRGQVVLYRSPLDPETIAIKRILALEGDIVRTRDPYPKQYVTIPRGQVWVEGDEAFHSMDSNYYGPIPIGLITAKVTHILFPFRRAGRIGEEFKGRPGAIVRRGPIED